MASNVPKQAATTHDSTQVTSRALASALSGPTCRQTCIAYGPPHTQIYTPPQEAEQGAAVGWKSNVPLRSTARPHAF